MSRFALGVDIGGTNTKVALVNDAGDVAKIERFPTGSDAAALIANIRDAAARCKSDAPLLGAGVAVAGFINAAH
ncbi:MAG TPA: ROK family protein, partial [Bryobacteraceae bacterium]|nr:ROK family protein [Bryobacteraceae bacterium]